MEYMTNEQEKLWEYLEWLRSFVVKYKAFDNKTILNQNLSKKDEFNVGMLRMFFDIISMYVEKNNINIKPENNIKEYHVFFRKTYFNIRNEIGTDNIYISKTDKKDCYYIDLSNLVGNRYSKTNNDLNNIHHAIKNLLEKGLEIDEIRKIIYDYLNAFEQEINCKKEK